MKLVKTSIGSYIPVDLLNVHGIEFDYRELFSVFWQNLKAFMVAVFLCAFVFLAGAGWGISHFKNTNHAVLK